MSALLFILARLTIIQMVGFYSAPQCKCRNARIASVVLATAIPSVRLSHTGIVSKPLHVARCSLHCHTAKCV